MDQGQNQEIHLEISGWIRNLRIQAGLNLNDVAVLLDETTEGLNGLEKGKPIPLYKLAILAELYRVSREELFQKIHSVQKKYWEASKS
jgi:DNA-binding XRE family transcriptional regulator